MSRIIARCDLSEAPHWLIPFRLIIFLSYFNVIIIHKYADHDATAIARDVRYSFLFSLFFPNNIDARGGAGRTGEEEEIPLTRPVRVIARITRNSYVVLDLFSIFFFFCPSEKEVDGEKHIKSTPEKHDRRSPDRIGLELRQMVDGSGRARH